VAINAVNSDAESQGLKNEGHLPAGSSKGVGDARACQLQSCKHHMNPTISGTEYVLSRIGECSIQQLDELLPHRWAAART